MSDKEGAAADRSLYSEQELERISVIFERAVNGLLKNKMAIVPVPTTPTASATVIVQSEKRKDGAYFGGESTQKRDKSGWFDVDRRAAAMLVSKERYQAQKTLVVQCSETELGQNRG